MGGRRWPHPRSELGQGWTPAALARWIVPCCARNVPKMHQIDRKEALFRAKVSDYAGSVVHLTCLHFVGLFVAASKVKCIAIQRNPSGAGESYLLKNSVVC